MWRTIEQFPNWEQIKLSLEGLAHKKYTSEQILKLLGEFRFFSQGNQNLTANKIQDNFAILFKLYSKEIPDIFSKAASFLLHHPKHQIPLFLQDEDKQHYFKKQTILYLFCTMTLCLIPRQHFDSSLESRGKFNYLMDFSYIFSEEEYKTKTVVEFLKKEINNTKAYNEQMSIHRQVEKRSIEEIVEANKDNPMCPLKIQHNEASIEDFYGDLKADFANKFLGGGALITGCVQEEIMFTNHPQLFTAQLLCEVMKPNECIFLSGYKKYFKNSGYGWTAAYDGPEKHEYKYEPNGQAAEYITAIDAIAFGGRNFYTQFEARTINREILKAYCGFNFKHNNSSRVVTGNWGCGAFGGDLRIKFLIQWLACSLAKKEMIYCPFGHREVIEDDALISKISKLKVGQTYNLIHNAGVRFLSDKKGENIYQTLKDLL